MPLSDVFAAIRWWIAMIALGAACTPMVIVVLRRLPDRGYAFAKMAGVLLVSFIFWLSGSLGFMANNLGAIIASLLLVSAVSVWVLRRHGNDISVWLQTNRRQVLITELVFALIFFSWAWVRAENPAISGTEKPMEFAFLNAAGLSDQMPPLDPWLSGYAISYYYFGYVMTSVIARLAFVTEPLAFNLGLAWLAAGTAVGAFGIVYNLVASESSQKARRSALTLGLIAALAIPFAGNMQILFELLHANGIGSPQFWSWLDVRDISGPPTTQGFGEDGPRFWWWWRSSRVIHEYHLSGVPEEGLEPIAEFPAFSFILGDMHPHVLALPFAFLSLALALCWWLTPTVTGGENATSHGGLAARTGFLLGQVGVPLYGATVLVLGGLAFLNTWDILSHLFIIVGAFVLYRWRCSGKWESRHLQDGAIVGFMLVVPAVLLYLPFYIGFRSQTGPPFLLPMLMQPTRLTHYLIIFGMPLLPIVVFLVTLAMRQRRAQWRAGLATALGILFGLLLLMFVLGLIIAPSIEGSSRLMGLATDLGASLSPAPTGSIFERLGWALRAVSTLAGPILLARLSNPWLILFLTFTIGVVVAAMVAFLEQKQDARATALEDGSSSYANVPFVLLLLLTATLLTLGPEFVYLRDNFGQRLNTIFKFYYQAWLLFGVGALFALYYLYSRARVVALVGGTLYTALLVIAMLFPVYGVTSRAQEYALPSTLNGLAHYSASQPDELAALTWLRQNAEGTPVIVEAVGGQYSPQGHGRVSSSTGLPTLVGWPGSEYQWRGTTPVPAEREAAARTIYASPDWSETARLLNQHDVSLIYVGPLEASTYGPGVYEKFSGRLEVAYANESVMIYRWLPQ